MPYYRFEEACRTLTECVDAIDIEVDAGLSYDEFVAGLSSDHDRDSFEQLVIACENFIEVIEWLKIPVEDVDEDGVYIRM